MVAGSLRRGGEWARAGEVEREARAGDQCPARGRGRACICQVIFKWKGGAGNGTAVAVRLLALWGWRRDGPKCSWAAGAWVEDAVTARGHMGAVEWGGRESREPRLWVRGLDLRCSLELPLGGVSGAPPPMKSRLFHAAGRESFQSHQ